MHILLEGIGKKFGKEWIFRGLNQTFFTGQATAITGSNGSGKSTLMLLISGWSLPSAGSIAYKLDGKTLNADRIYRHIDFIAPYTELIEELSLLEFLQFHFTFKRLKKDMTIGEVIQRTRLEGDSGKYIRYFSSGMKQRLKLATGLYSDCPVLLLDEPTTNLDRENKNWYNREIREVLDDKMVIIASNQPEEYKSAEKYVDIGNYK